MSVALRIDTSLGQLDPQALDARLATGEPWTAEHVREVVQELRANAADAHRMMALSCDLLNDATKERDAALAKAAASEKSLAARISIERSVERLLLSVYANFPDDQIQPSITLKYLEAEDHYFVALVRYEDRTGAVIRSVRAKGRELGKALEQLIVEFDAWMEKGS